MEELSANQKKARPRRAPQSKADKLAGLKTFHEQAQGCGGLMEYAVVQRRELPGWIGSAMTGRDADTRKRAYRMVKIVGDAVEHWPDECGDKLCLTCDNSTARLADVEAFVILEDRGGDGGLKMVMPLCRSCANNPGLDKLILEGLKRLAWPDLRIAPPKPCHKLKKPGLGLSMANSTPPRY